MHAILMLLLDLLALSICAAVCYDAMHPPTVGSNPTVDAPTLPTLNAVRAVFGLAPLAF